MAIKVTPGRAIGWTLASLLTWGMTTCGVNKSVRHGRLDEAKKTAKDSCTVPSSDPFLTEQLRSQCEGQLDQQIDDVDYSARDLDQYNYFLPLTDKAGNRAYADLKSRTGPELSALARAEFDKRAHWRTERQAFEHAVQNIAVDGKKPFAGASVQVELFELQADRAAMGAVTGDFRVTVTGRGGVAGGKGSHVFSYDYVQKKITQKIDDVTTTIDLSGESEFMSLWNAGGSTFSAHGAMKTERAMAVACGQQNYPACAVVDAIHKTLNGFSAGEMGYLQDGLDRLTRQGTDRNLAAVAKFPGTSL